MYVKKDNINPSTPQRTPSSTRMVIKLVVFNSRSNYVYLSNYNSYDLIVITRSKLRLNFSVHCRWVGDVQRKTTKYQFLARNLRPVYRTHYNETVTVGCILMRRRCTVSS